MDLTTVEEFVPAPDTTWRPGDAYCAGGSWLFSEPQPEVRRLIDLTGYGWPALVADPSGLTIAATCTLAELAAYRAEHWPAVALFEQACHALLGSFKVWTVATVGGNICLALPAGPMTALAAALDGVCTIWSPDGSVTRRSVPDLVLAPRRTSLAPGELLRSVRLPASALRSRVAFRQMSLTPVGRSASVVIGRVGAEEAVFTVTAATQRPVQLRFAGLPTVGEAVRAVEEAVICWHDDVHGSPRWRRDMTVRLLGEVVDELSTQPAVPS